MLLSHLSGTASGEFSQSPLWNKLYLVRRVQVLPCHRSLNRTEFLAYDPTRMTACEVRWKVQKLYVAGVMSVRMIGLMERTNNETNISQKGLY